MPDCRLPHYEVLNTLSAADVGEKLPWSIANFGIQNLWEACNYGKHALVGIVDSGCSLDHPEFAGRIVGNHGGRWGTAEDYNGHGSHVAGIIGAGHNDTGVAGLAPRCSFFIAKGLDKNGSGSNRDVAAAVRACVDAKCHVINMSLGSPGPDPAIRAEIERGRSRGVLFVCAAGNEGPGTCSWPAEWNDLVLSIGAIDERLRLANFSTTNNGVDFVAPGVQIVSTYKDGKYATLSGTSMATPWIAGLLALLTSLRIKHGLKPITGLDEITELLKSGTRDLGTGGRDPQFGWGLPVPAKLIEGTPVDSTPDTPSKPEEDRIDSIVSAILGILTLLVQILKKTK